MAFIERKNPIVINIKLTSKGRELLSKGELDFKYYAIGDSEIDYEFNANVHAVDSEYTSFDSTILRAADKGGKQISFIPRNLSGDPYVEMTNVPSTTYQVENSVESLGFFTDNNTKFIVDSNHVKQPDAILNMGNIIPNGDTSITLEKGELYGRSGEEPAVGDILFIKWSYTEHTTGFTVNTSEPRPHLFYKITGITSGSLASGSVVIGVDREIPDFTNILPIPVYNLGAMILYNELIFTGDTILNMSSTDYLNESVINFLENSQCPTIVFPYWNMSIIHTEEIAGVQAGDLKYTQFKNRTFGGFVSYIQNQAPTNKKLGVIHYTNSSPANVYGEGFLLETPTLDIPTIMWHKSSTVTLGTTLSPIGGQQLLSGLNIYYYDLADSTGFIVGKVFPNLKIFVIEDQELLFAMSYKSNRSWTVPDYNAGIGVITTECPTGATVTWSQPIIEDASDAYIESTEYCHSTQDWETFTGSITLTGVDDTGYRVCVYNESYASLTYICAYDYVNATCIDDTDNQSPANTNYSISLNNITNTESYFFGGCIMKD